VRSSNQPQLTVRWRALFDAMRVPWRDRGANTSRGHVSIKCPWCGNRDPSFHLTINESNGAYRCYRDPQLHAGWSLPWLLLGLGAKSREVDTLIEEYAHGARPMGVLQATPASPVDWDRQYRPAHLEAPALEYMRSRGYADPSRVCREHDLRFTKIGRMAWRILFPIDAGGEVLGTVGRAVRDSMEPRYLTNDPYGGCVYAPRRASRTRLLLLCAILGTGIPDARKLTLDLLARNADHVAYVPDADQVSSATYRLIKELELLPHISHIERLPTGRYKDLGEWTHDLGGLRAWLRDALSHLDTHRPGAARSRRTAAPLSSATPGASSRR
jgi:hypothetical protein